MDKFGKLTVQKYFQKDGLKKAICTCECGKETEVYLSNLNSGKTKSCGCGMLKKQHTYKDLKGMKFGYLKVLYPTEQRKGGCIVWACQCKCSKIVYIPANYLTRGFTKSCGCLRNRIYDLKNQKFGKLKVLKPLDKKLSLRTQWICKCSCGKYTTVTAMNLYYKHTKSCGCLLYKEVRTKVWIYVNKVDTFFESYFETNPLSRYFMVSENRQTKTV